MNELLIMMVWMVRWEVYTLIRKVVRLCLMPEASATAAFHPK